MEARMRFVQEVDRRRKQFVETGTGCSDSIQLPADFRPAERRS
jgi:hypothetical protein